ncbi:MAG: MBL fold metallo-hydrolase [Spirochaetales bacterium]|nr:MBL fold metallo-hydrolase [Leptospiraceae bacterium]MCP5483756.1 MBL fold metallo-hydrolase [Spirochaetales bacterium]
MPIQQIYTGSPLRNFTYLLPAADGGAIAIDPYQSEQLIGHLKPGQKITHIINTHEHADHTCGNAGLVERFAPRVHAHENAHGVPGMTDDLRGGESFELSGGRRLEVLYTPGHTFAHVTLVIREGPRALSVITGDTLFNAGVGNCYNGGDPGTLFESMQAVYYGLPDDVRVYPGHDYLQNNLKFTLHYETQNTDARELLERISRPGSRPVISTIGLERAINMFFRLENPEIRERLQREVPGFPERPAARQVFLALRSLRDRW